MSPNVVSSKQPYMLALALSDGPETQNLLPVNFQLQTTITTKQCFLRFK